MKKIFLLLAFMLIGTMTFATNGIEKTTPFNDLDITIEINDSTQAVSNPIISEYTQDVEAFTKSIEKSNLDINKPNAKLYLVICEYIGGGWWYCEVYEL